MDEVAILIENTAVNDPVAVDTGVVIMTMMMIFLGLLQFPNDCVGTVYDLFTICAPIEVTLNIYKGPEMHGRRSNYTRT